jgi:radical SAM superfamily enzyme YgiQ (UPF0313 family)
VGWFRVKTIVKRLLLINPVGRRSGYLLSKSSTLPPLSLAYVAAVTPPSWEVVIRDENFTPFAYEEADIVGITAFTSNINRAYEIAQLFKKKKIKVVLGGIHASMMPDEGLRYADSVVVGEAEGIWNQVIQDFENNTLRDKYFGPRLDISQLDIIPRRDLLHPDYFWSSIQTSRGCPFRCHFCSVSRYLGHEYRQKSAEGVLKELDNIANNLIFFLDDNLIGHTDESRKRAEAIFTGMITRGYHKKWWMQTSINATEDEKLIEMAAQAGCLFAFIGFETINSETLSKMRKGINLKIGTDNYKKVIRLFHKYGIGVYGAFILGNDYESPAYYKELAKFLINSGIDIVQISLLTPLPGTQLMEQLAKEDRLVYADFPKDWDKYRLSYIVHRPEGIEEETIYRGDNFIKNTIYSFPMFPFRLLKSFIAVRGGINFYFTKKYNLALKKAWEGSHYYNEYPHYL